MYHRLVSISRICRYFLSWKFCATYCIVFHVFFFSLPARATHESPGGDLAGFSILLPTPESGLVAASALRALAERGEAVPAVETGRDGFLLNKILVNSARSKSRFGIVAVRSDWFSLLRSSNSLLVLPETLRKPGFLSRFQATSLDHARSGPDFFALPLQTDMLVMLYRPDLLERLALSVPETLEDMMAAARALAGEGDILPFCPDWRTDEKLIDFFLGVAIASGFPPFHTGGELRPGPSTLQELLDMLKEISSLSGHNGNIDVTSDLRHRLEEDNCAMTWAWTGDLEKLESLKVETRVAMFPVARQAVPAAPTRSWYLAIPSNLAPDKRDDAVRLLGRLLSPAMFRRYISAGMKTPALNRRVENDPVLPDEGTDVTGLLQKMEEKNRLMYPIPPGGRLFPEQTKLAGKILKLWLQDTLGPEDAVEALEKALESRAEESR